MHGSASTRARKKAHTFRVFNRVRYAIFGRGFTLTGAGVVYLLAATLLELVKGALRVLVIVVIVQAVLSWVAPDGPLAGLLNALTFPFLRPLRRYIPPIGGTLDLTPLILLLVLYVALIVVNHLRAAAAVV